MVSANREMAVYCFDTLVAHYNSEQAPPPAFDEGQHPLFVTWKKAVNGGEPRLRGCIGTLEARCLINGFRDYALTSALRDRRFPPIQAKELPYLECTVSILTDYETALHYLDWEIGKHGLIIEFTDPDYNTRRSATYLPEVAAHEGKILGQTHFAWWLGSHTHMVAALMACRGCLIVNMGLTNFSCIVKM
ncbi:uncharacterized protein At2g38710 isoform X2 [Magnolia sinica]|uniref:uncharacterized protein At2g38710 isoform X2 n=1 Tax=Magnolia sinica TaxID=86752 RepID=UPI00265B189F|nr:uncharacterized protein At2g38710 isoform X2 [Magnolia sinica]